MKTNKPLVVHPTGAHSDCKNNYLDWLTDQKLTTHFLTPSDLMANQNHAQILRELNHAKVIFQQRALCAWMGLPEKD